MSKYTTQVRFIVENYSQEGFPISQRIEQALPSIFDFNYPLWSESYKRTLEKKIIMHYFNKEIGLETVGLWKFYLEERLNLIMPYYNEMYKTVSNSYDWLEDINVTETYDNTKETSGNMTDTSTGKVTDNGQDTTTSSINENSSLTGTKTGKDLKSDLPQANYQGLDYGTELHDTTSTDNNTNTHEATSNATVDKNNVTDTMSNTNTNTNSNTKDKFTRTHKGLNGSKSKTQLNLEYRQSLINIDNMVIDELKDLFMMIY